MFLLPGQTVLAILLTTIVSKVSPYAYPFPEGQAPDGTKYKTAYRCEGEELRIACDSGETIQVIRANYGRFSIAICNKHGYTDWSVNCMSPKTTRVLQTRCDGKRQCTMLVNSAVFGDPCPSTHKYVEVHYACLPKVESTTTKRPLPPWFLQSGAGNLWNTPQRNDKTEASTDTSTMSSTSTLGDASKRTGNIFSLSGMPESLLPSPSSSSKSRKPILVTDDIAYQTSSTPLRIPITTPTPTTTPTTTTPSTTTTAATTTTTSEASTVTVSVAREVLDTEASIGDSYEVTEPDEDMFTTVNQKHIPTLEVFVEPEAELGGEPKCRPSVVRNIKWNWTMPGDVAIMPCPLGTTGLARWHCLDGGHWSNNHPDMSDCKSESSAALESRVRAEDPENVLASALAHLTSGRHLYGGDVATCVAVMKTIGNRLRFILQTGLSGPAFYNKAAYVQEVTANVVRAASNLLSENKRLAWLDLKTLMRMKTANNLLLTIEETAFLLAEVTDIPEIIEESSDNIFLAISVLDQEYISNKREGIEFPPLKIRQTSYGHVWNTVRLPKPSLEANSYLGYTKSVFLAYKTLHDLLMPAEQHLQIGSTEDTTLVLNSRIVSASLGKGRHIQLPEQPVILELKHLAPNLTEPVCVFWDFELSGWSDSGCSVVESNDTRTLCKCDHLTNFALLMRQPAGLHPKHNNGAKMSKSTVLVLEVVTYVAVALSLLFIGLILYKYHGKVNKLLAKYNCPLWFNNHKQKEVDSGCPKSQSFYSAAAMGQLVQVTHNPSTASPQTPSLKTHTTMEPSPQLSQCDGQPVYQHYNLRPYMTLQGQGVEGHVTVNPYHHYGDDLHDGLAATMRLRDSVYMSPQLLKLTSTLRSKKKLCNGGHPEQPQNCPDNNEEVVFRAVSPHGHVYWEIDPSRQDRFRQTSEASEDEDLRLRRATPAEHNYSRQSSSRYSDSRPLISASPMTSTSEVGSGSGTVLVNPFADVQLLPMTSIHALSPPADASLSASPAGLRPELRFNSLRGHFQGQPGSKKASPSKNLGHRASSARMAKMKEIARSIEHLRMLQQQQQNQHHPQELEDNPSTSTNAHSTSNTSGSSGSTSPATANQGIPVEVQQQVHIRDIRSIPVSVDLTKSSSSVVDKFFIKNSPRQRMV